MEVLTLTTLFSVLFAVLFFALFMRTRQKSDSCAEQDSLIPFRHFDASPTAPEPRDDEAQDNIIP